MSTLKQERGGDNGAYAPIGLREVTRVITLVQAIAETMGIEKSRDPELGELMKDVDPDRVLDRIEESSQRAAEDG